MASRLAPGRARIDADNPSPGLRFAACNDWRTVSTFHVGAALVHY
jgi:hypothetical protein